jgi:hypothetical protein
MRFQYAIMPIALISWPFALKGLVNDRNFFPITAKDIYSRIKVILFFVSLFVITVFTVNARYYRTLNYKDGRYLTALMLSKYQPKGYMMVTTEAGLLPLYSDWDAIDALGYNDRHIARKGAIYKSYLKLHKPELIMFHAGYSPIAGSDLETKSEATADKTLKEYADENGYTLAASFGDSPYDTHYYYVRSDFPDSEVITKGIRDMDYTWYKTGRKSLNYAVLDKAR